MKQIVITFIIIACSTTINSQEKLSIDISKSTINWKGFYLFHFNGHDGAVQFKEGYIIKTNGNISGGSYTIDMNTITNSDIEKEDDKTELVNHLKSDDFFGVKDHPAAKLVITDVAYKDATHLNIEANLTMKGITKLIRFGAELINNGSHIKARFKINRQLWDINFNFIKDSAISDAIEFNVELYF